MLPLCLECLALEGCGGAGCAHNALRLLNVTVVRSSNLNFDLHVDATISNFAAYTAPKFRQTSHAVVLSEPH